MASLPPQRAAPRRSSPEQIQAEPSQPRATSDNDQATSSTSEDFTIPSRSDTTTESIPETQTVARPSLRREETDLKKCWICFADESEDTPQTSRWRSPCPCALVAHEECLLDWIADMESPSSRKRSLAPPKLLCPQCKTEIHLARPWDPVVELVKSLDRATAKIVGPAAVFIALNTIQLAFTEHGIHSIFAVFGSEDAHRITDPFVNPDRRAELWTLPQFIQDVGEHWRLRLGLPLITPMLILSRTSLADSILPVLPIVFFATQGDATEQPPDLLKWPPSASMTLAVLPYLRGMYNAYYRRVWTPHVQRWMREIQPRANQSEEGQGEAAPNDVNAQRVAADEGEGIFEIRVDGNIWNDWGADDDDEQQPEQPVQQGNGEDVQRQEAREALNALLNEDNQQPAAAAGGAEQQQQQGGIAAPEQRQPAAQGNDRRLSFSTTGLAERILGALLFPSIAGLSGEVLLNVLPRSWTTSTSSRPGLLAQKWGRSIVGGCLFVVLKDAVMLYVRWKMAQQHRKRRVLDYDRRGKGRA